MPRQTIQYHPDSSETETQSFIFIGITILFSLTAVLLAFIMLDDGTFGIPEILMISFFVVVPIALGIFAIKSNKESMAYDRASQIVNYSPPVEMTVKNIEEVNFSTTDSEDKKVNELRYHVSLSKDSYDYLCVVKQKTTPQNLTDNDIGTVVPAYIDSVSEEVVAFNLNDSIIWGIPSVLLQKKNQT